MDKRYAIKVDIMKTPAVDGVTFNQQDRNSTVLVIAVTQNGQTVDLTGKQVSMAFRKPDGTIVTQDEANGITVTAPLTGTFEIELFTEVLTAQGKVAAEITITDGDSIVVLDPFAFKVNSSIRNGAETISKNDLSFMANIELLESNYDAMYAKADAAKTAADAATAAVGTAQSTADAAKSTADANAAALGTDPLKTTAQTVRAAINENHDQIGIQQKRSDGVVSISEYADLQAAITANAGIAKTLYIASTINVTANTTIPSNIRLYIDRAGKFNISSGVVLTINCSIQAGLWKIFDGAGTVAGKPKIEAAYPEWFGAVVDDTTVDNALYLDKAQKFFPKVRLSAGVYNLLTVFVPVYSASFEGVGRLSDTTSNITTLQQLNDVPVIRLDNPMSTFRNLAIKGVTTNPNNHGIMFPSKGSRATIQNVYIGYCGGHGVFASGSNTTGVDYVQFTDVKIDSNEGYGIKLDLDPTAGNGFNTSLFTNVECTLNQKGGFYVDQARSLTFIRCHAFWNEDRNGATVYGYSLKSNASNIKVINSWSETTGEHSIKDPQHKCAGFFVDGAKNVDFDNCIAELESRAFHVKSGDNIVINNPVNTQLNWVTSLDILIEAAATNVRVINYTPNPSARVANFSPSSYIQLNGAIPSSGRIPMNATYRFGQRGKSECYKQGSRTAYEFSATVNGNAGDNFLTWTANSTTSGLRIGDNITIPGAGASGAGLLAQIIDIDFVANKLILDKAISTSVTGVAPATSLASVYTETWGVTSDVSTPQIGDKVFDLYPNINKRMALVCTAITPSPVWQAVGSFT